MSRLPNIAITIAIATANSLHSVQEHIGQRHGATMTLEPSICGLTFSLHPRATSTHSSLFVTVLPAIYSYRDAPSISPLPISPHSRALPELDITVPARVIDQVATPHGPSDEHANRGQHHTAYEETIEPFLHPPWIEHA